MSFWAKTNVSFLRRPQMQHGFFMMGDIGSRNWAEAGIASFYTLNPR